MYNKDSDSLDTGAPDIRLSGNQQMASAPDPMDALNDMSMNVFGKPLDKLTPQQYDILIDMAKDQAAAPKQNLGIMASAPGTYTQNRKRIMAAGGGITQIGKPGGLVEPGISKYGMFDFITDPIKSAYDKIVDDIIPNELKNPVAAAVAANYLPTLLNKPTVLGQLGEKFPTVLGEDSMIGKGIEAVKSIPGNVMDVFKGSSGSDAEIDAIFKKPESDRTIEEKRKIEEWEIKNLGGQELSPFRKALATILPGGDTGYFDLYGGGGGGGSEDPSIFRSAANIGVPLGIGKLAYDYQKDYLENQPEFPINDTGITFQTAQQAMDDPNLRFKPKLEDTQLAAEGGRIGYAGGGPNQGSPGIMSQASTDTEKLKDLFSRLTELRKIPQPGTYKNFLRKMNEEKIIENPRREIGEEKTMTPLSDQSKYQNLMLLVQMLEASGMEIEDAIKEAQRYFGAEGFGRAEGGRIGFAGGKGIMMASGPYEGTAADADEHSYRMFGKPYNALNEIELEEFRLEMEHLQSKFGAAQGGRIKAQEGGLMNLGGMEKDYRQEGGFVPIGKKEKADDVPARLSVNEFVFTADAVRSAGGGDIDKGAEVMENLMENLEAGGKVSEESQGLEGARGMFANAQKLQNRII